MPCVPLRTGTAWNQVSSTVLLHVVTPHSLTLTGRVATWLTFAWIEINNRFHQAFDSFFNDFPKFASKNVDQRPKIKGQSHFESKENGDVNGQSYFWSACDGQAIGPDCKGIEDLYGTNKFPKEFGLFLNCFLCIVFYCLEQPAEINDVFVLFKPIVRHTLKIFYPNVHLN